MSFSKLIRKIHLWLGVTCGLIVSFSGLTGSLYVWQPEITRMLNSEMLVIKDENALGNKEILQTTISLIEVHKDSISKIVLPYREQQTISIEFKGGRKNYYHPSSGSLLGEKSNSIVFFETLLRLHRSLGIPDVGKYIVGVSALVFCFMLLSSGVYIWWTIYAKKLRKGFIFKWKSKKRKFNFDMHKVAGIYFFVPLFIIALSGAYFTYNSYYKSILRIFDEKPQVETPIESISHTSGITDFLSTIQDEYDIWAIHFPTVDSKEYRIRFIEDSSIQSGLRKTKEVRITNKGQVLVLSDYKSESFSNRMASQFYPIHIGEIAGILGRILVFISGLIPIMLFITGLKIYKAKRFKKFRS